MSHDNILTFCLALLFISLFWRCQSGYLAQNNVSCLKTKERFRLAENLRITCSSASVFSKVLAAYKIDLTTASARKTSHTARLRANARKDHSTPPKGKLKAYTKSDVRTGTNNTTTERNVPQCLLNINMSVYTEKAKVENLFLAFRLIDHSD